MDSFICSGCSATNYYKLNAPVAVCCNSCQCSFIIEKDLTLSTTYCKWHNYPMISMLQLNAKGVYQNKPFEIIGYLRNVTSMAVSNEWLMYFGKNDYLWLTESNLNYFVFEKNGIALAQSDIKNKKAEDTLLINEKKYVILEVSKLIKCNMLGEIPAESLNDEPYFKYELKAVDNTNYATVCIFNANLIEAYVGNKIKIEDLKLSGIHEYKDWL